MQVFRRSTTSISRFTIFGAIFVLLLLAWMGEEIQRSPYVNYMGVAQTQPVPFSHQHHVGGLGIDCRYCHTSVENSSFAGLPPTKTCMNCHSQIWTNTPMLEPVRASFRTDQSMVWTRVNDLPDFVFFDHSIHINKGVGCYSCHGAVDRMPLTYAAHTLQMEWCIQCHRHPEQELRPREQVFNLEYTPPANQMELGTKLARQYHLRSQRDLTSCSTCHR